MISSVIAAFSFRRAADGDPLVWRFERNRNRARFR